MRDLTARNREVFAGPAVRLLAATHAPVYLALMERHLDVMSREVGQSGDWWAASDGGVGSVVIVEVQPAR